MNKDLSAKHMLVIGLLFMAIAYFWDSFIGYLIGIAGFVILLFALARWMRDRRH